MTYRTYFPAANDESAASILAMVVHTTDSAEARRIHFASLQRANPLANSLPCRAMRFCAVTEGAYGGPSRVLAAHSLLSWNSIGMSPESAQALELALTDGKRRTPCPTFDALLRCGNRTALKCPECSRIDQYRYGRSANYCTHCIDYVTRCLRHEMLLECAGDSSRLEALLIHERNDCARENSLQFARVAANLAAACPRQPAWREIVRLLREKQFVSESGRWHVAALRSEFQKIFHAGFEDPRLTYITEHGDYVEAAVRATSKGRSVHPVMVTLLRMFATDVEALPVHKPHFRPRPVGPAPEALLKTQRSAWLDIASRGTGLSRSETRLQAPALWTWLYRNDKAWLEAHQECVHHSRAVHRLQRIPAAVSDTIAVLQVDPLGQVHGGATPPSAYRMRLAYGIREYAFNRVRKKPGRESTNPTTPR